MPSLSLVHYTLLLSLATLNLVAIHFLIKWPSTPKWYLSQRNHRYKLARSPQQLGKWLTEKGEKYRKTASLLFLLIALNLLLLAVALVGRQPHPTKLYVATLLGSTPLLWSRKTTQPFSPYYVGYCLLLLIYTLPFLHTLHFLHHPNTPIIPIQLMGQTLLLAIYLDLGGFLLITSVGVILATLTHLFLYKQSLPSLTPHTQAILYGFLLFLLPTILLILHTKRKKNKIRIAQAKLLGNALGHELRAHLNIIGGYAQLMQKMMEEKLHPKEGEKGISLPAQDAQALIDCIPPMLKVHKMAVKDIHLLTTIIQNNQINKADFAPIFVHKMLERSYKVLAAQYPEKIILHNPTSKIKMALPIALFHHALLNIVQNAFEHGKAAQVTLSWEETPSSVKIHITNNGTQIPKHKLSTLYQSSNQRKGRGIGLPFVQLCIDISGGEIDIPATSTAETRFTINYPKSLQTAPPK